nr:zinc finger matrin-type protein CG9776 isoform X1 [Danaus plexippus plexippus]
MSRENYGRKGYYNRDNRDREWSRNDYRYEKHRQLSRKRSRTPPREEEKRTSRTPRKNEKEMMDDNILSEISKLPEPSELWDSHLQDGFSAPQQQSFPQEGNAYVGNYQPSYSGLYDDFPSVGGVPTAPQPPEISSWNQMSLPPPPAPTFNVEDQIKKEAAIESEMRHQKIALSKQREDYIKKAAILKKELDTLKDQRSELRGDNKRSPSPDTKRFLKENTKLQLEIQNKLKTINNVVDMLNGIIGEEADLNDTDTPTQERERERERGTKRKSRSPSNKKFNYVYYDPEMHWCRVCNEFPSTAKDYLNHLHSPAHHKMAAAHMEAPWHSVTGANEGFPSYPSAPTKRTPIRGLQFFVPSSAWYCKLCDVFIGDLHCASAHLKCVQHSKNYTNFVEQNPHWETDWMSDRQKALEKARAGNKLKLEDKPAYTAHTITFNKDGFHTKRKTDSPSRASDTDKKKKKEKKKKSKRKKSSSSSSDSSSSGSDSEPKKKKKSKKSKNKFEEEKLTEWMSSIQMERLNDNDRKLLDNIKSRIKMDKDDRREKREQRDPARQYRDERRESRSRDERDRRDERRRDERRDERHERRDDGREERHERRDDGREDRHERRDEGRDERTDAKKTDIRKMMPFIGKMPVYKNLTKTSKTEEPKKEEKKKKEDEATKKRRVEMDAEIQKKVAEFKEKIAKAQLERQQAEQMPSLLGAMPGTLPGTIPPAMTHAFLPPPPAPTAPAHLPKDFQDALDIIFPSEVKGDGQAEMYQTVPGLAPPGAFPGLMGGMMAPFQQLGLLAQPPVVVGFDVNTGMFQQQVYDAHVTPTTTTAADTTTTTTTNDNQTPAHTGEVMEKKDPTSRNKEELEELALLGIDASDVGAGM